MACAVLWKTAPTQVHVTLQTVQNFYTQIIIMGSEGIYCKVIQEHVFKHFFIVDCVNDRKPITCAVFNCIPGQ